MGDPTAEMVAALDRVIQAEIASLRREILTAEKVSERALNLAAAESRERLLAHNGLIEQMRQQAATFATREIIDIQARANARHFELIDRFQSRVTGALILISIVIPIATALIVHLLPV